MHALITTERAIASGGKRVKPIPAYPRPQVKKKTPTIADLDVAALAAATA